MIGLHAGGSAIGKIRGFDVDITASTELNPIGIEGDIASSSVNDDFFLCHNVNFAISTDNLQILARQELQLIVLRLNRHGPLIGD